MSLTLIFFFLIILASVCVYIVAKQHYIKAYNVSTRRNNIAEIFLFLFNTRKSTKDALQIYCMGLLN